MALPTGQQIVTQGRKVLGVKYHWGGESISSGFDCSGLVYWIYKSLGVNVSRLNATGESHWGTTVPKIGPLSSALLHPGDLLFFNTDSNPSTYEHVAIYEGILGGKPMMLEAPHKNANVRSVDLRAFDLAKRYDKPVKTTPIGVPHSGTLKGKPVTFPGTLWLTMSKAEQKQVIAYSKKHPSYDWSKNISTSVDVPGVVKDIWNTATAVPRFLKALSQPQTWIRVLEVIGGGLIFVYGGHLLLNDAGMQTANPIQTLTNASPPVTQKLLSFASKG